MFLQNSSLNILLCKYLPRNFVLEGAECRERQICNLNNFNLDSNL